MIFQEKVDVLLGRNVLLGLCENSPFDDTYSWSEELVGGKYTFVGYSDSRIYYDNKNMSEPGWKLELLSDPGNVYALAQTQEMFPFGTVTWHFFGTCKRRNADPFAKLSLNFNACEDDEYNCDNGNCIPASGRCNGINDCGDMTDERFCSLIKWNDKYLKDVPAPPEDESKGQLEVNVSMELLQILQVNDVNFKLRLQLGLTMEWVDRRLTFAHLKENDNLNIFKEIESQLMWTPELHFANTVEKESTVLDERTLFKVARCSECSPRYSSKTRLHNAHFFNGRDSTLHAFRIYTPDFLCFYDMGFYPFDTQHCTLYVVPKFDYRDQIRLVASGLKDSGAMDGTLYVIKDVDMEDGVRFPHSNSTAVTLTV